MANTDKGFNLRVELDTKNCELSAAEIEKMERGLDPLRDPVKQFPVSDLYVTVTHHPRSQDYRVKTSLVLTGKTLFTGDHDLHVYPAFERCVRKLLNKVRAYKSNLENAPEQAKHAKGTAHDVVPTQEPDAATLEKALQQGDYAAFRRATFVYEEAVRNRVGRWLNRYPEVNAKIGDELKIADIVEEVFLNAFERFDQRPQAVRLSTWLEDLIDPSIKLLMKSPDTELENISFARSMMESPRNEDE